MGEAKNFVSLFAPERGSKSKIKFLTYPFFGKSFLKKK